MIAMEVAGLRAEHDQVLLRLSARSSMVHLAHAVVSAFICLTFLAASAKFWWDFSEYHPEYFQASLGVATAAIVYAAVRGAVGARHFRRERVELSRLIELRTQLRIDDAANLLPLTR